MHDMLRDRILRNLDALPEERLYQVLDYIEFLSSKYARDGVRPAASPLQKFGERLEDRLRGNRVGIDAIRGTLEVVGTADRVVSGLREVGKSLLREVGAAGGPPPAPRPGTPQPRAQPPQRPEPQLRPAAGPGPAAPADPALQAPAPAPDRAAEPPRRADSEDVPLDG